MYKNPDKCPYTGQYGGSFPGLQDLNFNNTCTNEFIRDVCLYWIDVFKIDGIRFDNTVNFYVAGNPHGLKELISNIQSHMASLGEQNFSLTLEHLQMDAIPVTKDTNATSYWDNSLYGCTFQYLWWNQIDSKLLNALNNQRFLDSADRVPTIYNSNHDHSNAAWQAGARDNKGSMNWYKTQPYVIALYTSPSTPMIQNGQEFGVDHWIPEDDKGTGRRVVPRPLQWKLTNDDIGQTLSKLHKRMAEIRHNYPGMRSAIFAPQPWEEWQTQFNPEGYGIDTLRQLAIYRRWGNDANGNEQQFVIVLNFFDAAQDIEVPFPQDGEWTDLLSNYDGSWKVWVTGKRFRFRISSNWGHVFFK
jgi:pullulanase